MVNSSNSPNAVASDTFDCLPSLDQKAIQKATEDDIDNLISAAKSADSLCYDWDDAKTMFEIHQRHAAFHLRKRARKLLKNK